jgi:hypothetical protein
MSLIKFDLSLTDSFIGDRTHLLGTGQMTSVPLLQLAYGNVAVRLALVLSINASHCLRTAQGISGRPNI